MPKRLEPAFGTPCTFTTDPLSNPSLEETSTVTGILGVVKGLATDVAAPPFGLTVVSEPGGEIVVTDEPLPPGFVEVDEFPRDVKMTINTMTAAIPRALEIKNRRLIFMKNPSNAYVQCGSK
jgi:hypothetical protein